MDAIEKILKQQVAKNKTPSVHYIVFDKDKIIRRNCYGLSDIKNNKQAGLNTTYHAFSVTKTFTALSIMQLAEHKTIHIEKPAITYLPGFPYSAQITIRQLLTHSAGIPNPIPISWIHLAEEHDVFDRNSFFKHIMHKHSKTRSLPNTKFAYSNLGYVLLGQVIEQVTGMRYEDYVRMHILSPLNIVPEDLDFTITNREHHAKGYQKTYTFSNSILGLLLNKKKYMGATENKWRVFNTYYVNGAAYGGLIGTPDAFVTYIQELLKPNCNLISDTYKQILFTENYTNNNKPTGMCHSWFSGNLNGRQYYAHAGGGGGYYCEVRIYPQDNMGSVIMFNRTGMTDIRFLDTTDRYIFQKL